jgi:hypothetical protein
MVGYHDSGRLVSRVLTNSRVATSGYPLPCNKRKKLKKTNMGRRQMRHGDHNSAAGKIRMGSQSKPAKRLKDSLDP